MRLSPLPHKASFDWIDGSYRCTRCRYCTINFVGMSSHTEYQHDLRGMILSLYSFAAAVVIAFVLW